MAFIHTIQPSTFVIRVSNAQTLSREDFSRDDRSGRSLERGASIISHGITLLGQSVVTSSNKLSDCSSNPNSLCGGSNLDLEAADNLAYYSMGLTYTKGKMCRLAVKEEHHTRKICDR